LAVALGLWATGVSAYTVPGVWEWTASVASGTFPSVGAAGAAVEAWVTIASPGFVCGGSYEEQASGPNWSSGLWVNWSNGGCGANVAGGVVCPDSGTPDSNGQCFVAECPSGTEPDVSGACVAPVCEPEPSTAPDPDMHWDSTECRWEFDVCTTEAPLDSKTGLWPGTARGCSGGCLWAPHTWQVVNDAWVTHWRQTGMQCPSDDEGQYHPPVDEGETCSEWQNYDGTQCVNPSCGQGYEWNDTVHACVAEQTDPEACGAGSHYVEGVGCVSDAQCTDTGTYYDPSQGACVTPEQYHCPTGQTYVAGVGCITRVPEDCPEGTYRVNGACVAPPSPSPGSEASSSSTSTSSGGGSWDSGFGGAGPSAPGSSSSSGIFGSGGSVSQDCVTTVTDGVASTNCSSSVTIPDLPDSSVPDLPSWDGEALVSDAPSWGEIVGRSASVFADSPIGQAAHALNFSVPSGSCPVWTFEFFGTSIQVDVHCILFDSIKGFMGLVLLFAYSYLGFRAFIR
jgi:hypothetical protein